MPADPAPTSPAPPTPWRACWAVGLLAALLGACTIFPNLGASRMGPDEGLYALVTDDLRATGRWSTLYLCGDHPYFNKPPLYMWLSALTYDRLTGFEVRYRFWSAALGVAAVGLTAAWGSRLFRPAVGFVAGCALATNRSFLAEHGARFGGMDAALTACFVAILLLHGVARSGRRPWHAWAAAGAVAGVAAMLKPVAGLPMLAVVAVHAVTCRTRGTGVDLARVSWRHRLGVVSLVLGVAAAVGLPWYLLQLARFGPAFVEQVLVNQVAERAAGDGPLGEHQPWWYYLAALPRASNLFLLAPPAVLWLAGSLRARRGGRDARGLVLVVIVAWVGGFSLSSGKFLHYLYPAFGAVCVAIAVMIVESVGWMAGRWRGGNDGARTVGLAAAAVAIAFAGYVAFVAANPGSRDRSPLASWQVYRAFEPAIRDGRMDLVFWGVPNDPADWPDPWAVRPNFMIYLSHMAGGRRAGDADEVNRVLSSGRPALVVFGRGADVSRVPALRPGAERSWADARFSAHEKAYAVAAVGVDRLLRAEAGPGRADPRLTVAGGAPLPMAFAGSAAVTVAFPLPQPARVTFTVRPAPDSPQRTVRCVIRGAGAEPDVSIPFKFAGGTPVSAVATAALNAAKPTRTIELRIEPTDGDPTPVRAELLAVAVESLPPVPGAAGAGSDAP